jgi:hypothetical protein
VIDVWLRGPQGTRVDLYELAYGEDYSEGIRNPSFRHFLRENNYYFGPGDPGRWPR